MSHPDGRYIGTVKLGPKSQVAIPKEVRDIFGLGPGDQLIILADPEQGIALVRAADRADLIDAMFPGT